MCRLVQCVLLLLIPVDPAFFRRHVLVSTPSSLAILQVFDEHAALLFVLTVDNPREMYPGCRPASFQTADSSRARAAHRCFYGTWYDSIMRILTAAMASAWGGDLMMRCVLLDLHQNQLEVTGTLNVPATFESAHPATASSTQNTGASEMRSAVSLSCLAVSSSGRFVASSGASGAGLLFVWELQMQVGMRLCVDLIIIMTSITNAIMCSEQAVVRVAQLPSGAHGVTQLEFLRESEVTHPNLPS